PMSPARHYSGQSYYRRGTEPYSSNYYDRSCNHRCNDPASIRTVRAVQFRLNTYVCCSHWWSYSLYADYVDYCACAVPYDRWHSRESQRAPGAPRTRRVGCIESFSAKPTKTINSTSHYSSVERYEYYRSN